MLEMSKDIFGEGILVVLAFRPRIIFVLEI